MVGASGQLRCFLVQGFPCQPNGTEQPGQALLAASLCPVQRRALRVGVEQDHVVATQSEFASDMGGQGGLADPAFLVEQGDDQGRISPAKQSVSAPVHKWALAQ
ncbi:hypothetical protein D9M72_418390 [compost metagenome]